MVLKTNNSRIFTNIIETWKCNKSETKHVTMVRKLVSIKMYYFHEGYYDIKHNI